MSRGYLGGERHTVNEMPLRERIGAALSGILADSQSLAREVETDGSLSGSEREAVVLALSRIAAQADLVLGLLAEDQAVQ
jgi:hypothetical protein